jgi:hypothetical protein
MAQTSPKINIIKSISWGIFQSNNLLLKFFSAVQQFPKSKEGFNRIFNDSFLCKFSSKLLLLRFENSISNIPLIKTEILQRDQLKIYWML